MGCTRFEVFRKRGVYNTRYKQQLAKRRRSRIRQFQKMLFSEHKPSKKFRYRSHIYSANMPESIYSSKISTQRKFKNRPQSVNASNRRRSRKNIVVRLAKRPRSAPKVRFSRNVVTHNHRTNNERQGLTKKYDTSCRNQIFE